MFHGAMAPPREIATWAEVEAADGAAVLNKELVVLVDTEPQVSQGPRRIVEFKGRDKNNVVRKVAIHSHQEVEGLEMGKVFRWKDPRFYWFVDNSVGARVENNDMNNVTVMDMALAQMMFQQQEAMQDGLHDDDDSMYEQMRMEEEARRAEEEALRQYELDRERERRRRREEAQREAQREAKARAQMEEQAVQPAEAYKDEFVTAELAEKSTEISKLPLIQDMGITDEPSEDPLDILSQRLLRAVANEWLYSSKMNDSYEVDQKNGTRKDPLKESYDKCVKKINQLQKTINKSKHEIRRIKKDMKESPAKKKEENRKKLEETQSILKEAETEYPKFEHFAVLGQKEIDQMDKNREIWADKQTKAQEHIVILCREYYRKRSRIWHPDKSSDISYSEAANRFQRLKLAEQLLSSDKERRGYLQKMLLLQKTDASLLPASHKQMMDERMRNASARTDSAQNKDSLKRSLNEKRRERLGQTGGGKQKSSQFFGGDDEYDDDDEVTASQQSAHTSSEPMYLMGSNLMKAPRKPALRTAVDRTGRVQLSFVIQNVAVADAMTEAHIDSMFMSGAGGWVRLATVDVKTINRYREDGFSVWVTLLRHGKWDLRWRTKAGTEGQYTLSAWSSTLSLEYIDPEYERQVAQEQQYRKLLKRLCNHLQGFQRTEVDIKTADSVRSQLHTAVARVSSTAASLSLLLIRLGHDGPEDPDVLRGRKLCQETLPIRKKLDEATERQDRLQSSRRFHRAVAMKLENVDDFLEWLEEVRDEDALEALGGSINRLFQLMVEGRHTKEGFALEVDSFAFAAAAKRDDLFSSKQCKKLKEKEKQADEALNAAAEAEQAAYDAEQARIKRAEELAAEVKLKAEEEANLKLFFEIRNSGTGLWVGDKVRLHGLRSGPHLNGTLAVLESMDVEEQRRGRVCVKLPDGNLVRVKFENFTKEEQLDDQEEHGHPSSGVTDSSASMAKPQENTGRGSLWWGGNEEEDSEDGNTESADRAADGRPPMAGGHGREDQDMYQAAAAQLTDMHRPNVVEHPAPVGGGQDDGSFDMTYISSLSLSDLQAALASLGRPANGDRAALQQLLRKAILADRAAAAMDNPDAGLFGPSPSTASTPNTRNTQARPAQAEPGRPSTDPPIPKSSNGRKICTYYGTKKGCRNGSRCKFLHERPGIVSSTPSPPSSPSSHTTEPQTPEVGKRGKTSNAAAHERTWALRLAKFIAEQDGSKLYVDDMTKWSEFKAFKQAVSKRLKSFCQENASVLTWNHKARGARSQPFMTLAASYAKTQGGTSSRVVPNATVNGQSANTSSTGRQNGVSTSHSAHQAAAQPQPSAADVQRRIQAVAADTSLTPHQKSKAILALYAEKTAAEKASATSSKAAAPPAQKSEQATSPITISDALGARILKIEGSFQSIKDRVSSGQLNVQDARALVEQQQGVAQQVLAEADAVSIATVNRDQKFAARANKEALTGRARQLLAALSQAFLGDAASSSSQSSPKGSLAATNVQPQGTPERGAQNGGSQAQRQERQSGARKYPPGMEEYISRCLAACTSEEDSSWMKKSIDEVITKVSKAKSLWGHDWAAEAVPQLPRATHESEMRPRLDDVLCGLADDMVDLPHMVLLAAAHQVSTQLAELHDKGQIHGRVRAADVLVDKLEPDRDGSSVQVWLSSPVGSHTLSQEEFRWVAPETIKRRKFSRETDVYQMGILLWELWDKSGAVPFAHVADPEEAARRVMNGAQLDSPYGCLPLVWRLMQSCWAVRPGDRPTAKSVSSELSKLIAAQQTQNSGSNGKLNSESNGKPNGNWMGAEGGEGQPRLSAEAPVFTPIVAGTGPPGAGSGSSIGGLGAAPSAPGGFVGGVFVPPGRGQELQPQPGTAFPNARPSPFPTASPSNFGAAMGSAPVGHGSVGHGSMGNGYGMGFGPTSTFQGSGGFPGSGSFQDGAQYPGGGWGSSAPSGAAQYGTQFGARFQNSYGGS